MYVTYLFFLYIYANSSSFILFFFFFFTSNKLLLTFLFNAFNYTVTVPVSMLHQTGRFLVFVAFHEENHSLTGRISREAGQCHSHGRNHSRYPSLV